MIEKYYEVYLIDESLNMKIQVAFVGILEKSRKQFEKKFAEYIDLELSDPNCIYFNRRQHAAFAELLEAAGSHEDYTVDLRELLRDFS